MAEKQNTPKRYYTRGGREVTRDGQLLEEQLLPDDRDIFEKALDTATPLAAGYLGAKIGSKIARLSLRKKDYPEGRVPIDDWLARGLGGGYGFAGGFANTNTPIQEKNLKRRGADAVRRRKN